MVAVALEFGGHGYFITNNKLATSGENLRDFAGHCGMTHYPAPAVLVPCHPAPVPQIPILFPVPSRARTFHHAGSRPVPRDVGSRIPRGISRPVQGSNSVVYLET